MKRVIAICLALFGFVGFGAAPALAGGSGDFYKSRSCIIRNTSNTQIGKLVVTNYDYSHGQRYHYALYANSGFTKRGVYFNNWKAPSVTEGYVYYGTRSAVKNISASIQRNGWIYSCQFNL